MAFGIKRNELLTWKQKAEQGEIAFLTHYWIHPRYPQYRTVTKAGCCDRGKLAAWGAQYGLKPEWMDLRNDYPHFDLLGERQLEILRREKQWEHIAKFKLGGS